MDKNRRVRSRRGNMIIGEKDRQKRPGTPHRNRIQRPPNLIRMTESAAPVHTIYTEHPENEDDTDSDLVQKESNVLTNLTCTLLPQFQIQRINQPQAEENIANCNHDNDSAAVVETQPTDSIGSLDRTSESSHSKDFPLSGQQSSILKKDVSLTSSRHIPRPRGSTELRLKSNVKKNDYGFGFEKIYKIPTPELKPKLKRCQGSNTATAPGTGLPPLEGIHAGVGIGPGYFESEYDYTEKLSDIYNLDLMENLAKDEKEENKCADQVYTRIRVSKSIVFDNSVGYPHSFCGIIKLENISNYFMTFCIKSSEPEMFCFSPKIGFMCPKETQEVLIKTNPRYEFTFKDICSEVFKVFATPVYTRRQMEDEKLEVLWRAFGSKFFPRISAEEHTINFIYKYNSNYTKESVLSVISCNHRWLSSIWGNTKEVIAIETENPISEDEFYNSWPLEDDHYNFMTCRNQLDGWFWFLKKVKQETSEVKYELRQCIGVFLLMIFVLLVICSSFLSESSSPKLTNQYIQPVLNWIHSVDEEHSKPVVIPSHSIVEYYWSKAKEYLVALGVPF